MAQSRYRIYELSARAVMSYAVQESGQWRFALDRRAAEKCRSFSALHEQDGNALFFQIMCVLRGDDFSEPDDGRVIPDLSDVIFYMDFSGIFDGGDASPRQQIRRQKELIGCSATNELINITVRLLEEGYTEEDIRKIWGGNLLRVMTAIQDFQNK